MNLKTLADLDLRGKRVLMRVDFNVPLSKDGDVADDTRIRSALPSIEYVVDNGASLVLMSHLGRPGGEKNPSMSLKVVAYRLAELTDHPVKFVEDCIGDSVVNKISGLKEGEILLLENMRFHKEEKENDPMFAKRIARWGDLYANDAFGTAHRAHASTVAVPRNFVSRVAGFLLEKELTVLEGLIDNPAYPFVAVLGGAKVSGKIGLVSNLLNHVDRLIIGGGMAFTFLKAVGLEIGNSLLDEEYLPLCRDLMEKDSKAREKKIYLPVDCLVAREIHEDSEVKLVSTGDIPKGWTAVDIGEKSVDLFSEELNKARTVFWNGPMGIFEIDNFARGTEGIARKVAEITDSGAKTVVGGGDTVSALNKNHLSDRIFHISTGGGASLTLLEGGELPAVEVLEKKNN
ncbi:MAG: phosphoglycerate kinase [Candidatus Krumholzibacteriota bacterium]|nr:phosphoglycerate kinase [Candidatus Krumholzibacteriota bacterium]